MVLYEIVVEGFIGKNGCFDGFDVFCSDRKKHFLQILVIAKMVFFLT